MFCWVKLMIIPKSQQDVKIAQGTLLLAELDRIACYGIDENGSPLYYPTIVTGDFNSEPSFAVPQLMTGGQINLDKTFLYEKITN